MDINILAVGDVVGAPGLKMLGRHLRSLKKLYGVDFTVVNGENASGIGLTPNQADEIWAAGADVITLGNHTWNRREIVSVLEESPYILRPANYAPQLPGRGYGVFETVKGPVCVINLIGRLDMNIGPDNPFLMADRILPELSQQAKVIIVDMHAEATSEKLAMGYHLDGRVSALFGTHTHVPTADEQILPEGTGCITDVGMTGPACSILGIKPQQSIDNFIGNLTSRYEMAPGPCKLDAVLFTINCESGLCSHVERVNIHD